MKKNACIIICLILLFLNGSAFAHPDSGFLPDAIAETEYRIVIDLDPKDIETRIKLGIVLNRKNKLKEAHKQFEAVLELKPDNFDAHDCIGLVMLKQGNYNGAIKWFKKAIAINAGDSMVYYHLGQTYKALGDPAKAIKEYRRSLSLKENKEIQKELKSLEQLLDKKS